MLPCIVLSVLLQRPITIIYNDNDKSRFLYYELTRDYFAKGIDNEKVNCYLMQQNLLSRTKFIDATKNIKYRNIRDFPVILYGEHYSDKVELPEKAYQASTWGLKSLYITIHNMEADVTAWKQKCENIKSQKVRESIEDVLSWLSHAFNDDYIEAINELYSEYRDEYEMYNILKSRFGDRRGFPTARPAIFPPSPLMKYPWEK